MNNNSYSHSAAGFLPTVGRSKGTLASFLTVISAWDGRARQRRDLADMDAHLLADIGVSRAAADHEASKPFWLA